MAAPKATTLSPLINTREFNTLIADLGVKLVHYRSQPCPIGLRDQYDSRTVHADHSGCTNGRLYERAGEVTCLFQGNGTHQQLIDLGQLMGSTVQVTFPPIYDDSPEPCRIFPEDRLFLAEPQGDVVATQLFTASDTGIEKLRQQATHIEAIYDSEGKKYSKHDYRLLPNGTIQWLDLKRPFPKQVCSVRYRYLPYWYVQNLVHEIRVMSVQDPATFARVIERLPYSALLVRENVFELAQNDPDAKKNPRQAQAPSTTVPLAELFQDR